MNEYKNFNFANVVYDFRAKNGTVFFNHDDQIYIKRAGWFDIPYQLFTGGPVLFKVDELEEIVIKEPDMMRGYMDFKLKNNKKARVWLTRPGHTDRAKKIKKMIDARKAKLGRNNGLSKTDGSEE